MKIAGIIAEYNPFHNGHAYQIRCLRDAGYDYIIALMSGDFVQRGAPAVIGKSARARMALLGGCDLVLELPSLFAVSSAEYFCGFGAGLLSALGCVDTLSFGCETPDEELLQKTAAILNEEPPAYRKKLKELLKSGSSFASARAEAVTGLLPEAGDLLSAPNNILAVEYCRALQKTSSSMALFPILRKDSGYHSTSAKENYLSAEGIRSRLLSGEDVAPYLPEDSLQILSGEPELPFICPEDCYPHLRYCLLSEDDFTAFSDCSSALSSRILKCRDRSLSMEELILALKTKDVTYTRVSRVLMNILLKRKADDLTFYRNTPVQEAGYAKVLGFRKNSESLLGHLKERAAVPLITKCASAEKDLSRDTYRLFCMDIFSSRVYNLICSEKTGRLFPDDYHRPLEIIGTI